MQQRLLILSTITVVACATALTAYCYASEYLGFYNFLFLDFGRPGKASLSSGYHFLEIYSLIVSALTLGVSLAVCRRHWLLATVGLLVAAALFMWSAILPRY